MVGQFALGLAIATPITLGTNLYLRAMLATDVGEEYAFADYLGLRLVTTLVAFVCIGALAFRNGLPGANAAVILIVGGSKALDAFSDLFMGWFQQHGHLDYLGLTLSINGVVSLAALSIVLWWTHDIVWAALGTAFGSAFALFAVCLPAAAALLGRTQHNPQRAIASRHVLLPRFEVSILWNLARRATPLGLVSLRSVLMLNIPRYFIAYDLGEHDLGIFAAIAALVLSTLILASSLSLVALPRLAAHYAARNFSSFLDLLKQLAQVGLAQGIAGVIVASFAGRVLLSFFFGAEYARYNDVFVWLMFAALPYMLLSFFESALTAMRRSAIQLQIQFFTLILLCVFCFYLTPRGGIYGTAIAMFITAVLSALAYAFFIYRELNKGHPAALSHPAK
jgi:O-antigen/teichoic acid export membrane protein